MKLRAIGTCVLFVVGPSLFPREGGAQTVDQISKLDDRIRPRDRIFVTARDGEQTDGRFVRVSVDEVTIRVDGVEHAIPADAIGRIEKPDPVWNGALIGGGFGAFSGLIAGGASCSPHCAKEMSIASAEYGAIGAVIGALIDRSVRGYSPLYGPPLPSPSAAHGGAPLTSTELLWTRVRQGDRINVSDRGGGTITGKFVRTSATSVYLLVDGQVREIAADRIRRITRRGNQYRRGALIGALAFGAVGASSGEPDGVVAGAFVGALWGTLVGATIPKRLPIYDAGEPPKGVQFRPLVSAHRRGLVLSISFLRRLSYLRQHCRQGVGRLPRVRQRP